MASNVNVAIGNWQSAGTVNNVPKYTIDISFEWIDKNGVSRSGSETVTFPNILAQLPASWVKEEMEELMLRALRKKLGVDD